MESAIAGAIAEVKVRAGDEVSAGQLLARLAVAQLDASLTSKRQELEALKHQNALGEATDKAYSQRIDTALRTAARVLQSRSQLNQELRAQRRDMLDRTHELVREGAGSFNKARRAPSLRSCPRARRRSSRPGPRLASSSSRCRCRSSAWPRPPSSASPQISPIWRLLLATATLVAAASWLGFTS